MPSGCSSLVTVRNAAAGSGPGARATSYRKIAATPRLARVVYDREGRGILTHQSPPENAAVGFLLRNFLAPTAEFVTKAGNRGKIRAATIEVGRTANDGD